MQKYEDSYFKPYIRVDPIISVLPPSTIKILEENIKETLQDTGIGKYILEKGPRITTNERKNRQTGLQEAKKLPQ